MKETRRGNAWRFTQATLIKQYPPSQFTPFLSCLSENDKLEAWLLSLSDEIYDKIQPRYKKNSDNTISHDDTIVDEWEKEFWAKEQE